MLSMPSPRNANAREYHKQQQKLLSMPSPGDVNVREYYK
jgi:hypothetical protein